MLEQDIIQLTQLFVTEKLHGAEAGHDVSHAFRVYKNVLEIAKDEDCNELVVKVAALLHDIADAKFNNNNDEIGSVIATQFLTSINIQDSDIEAIVFIIKNISFHKGKPEKMTKELAIVQDADRLDAIGAIGIARAFSYGGFMSRPFYDIAVAPNSPESKENPNSINHFYEKLLLLKDMMNTDTAKKIAEQRHEFLEQYLQQFWSEVLS